MSRHLRHPDGRTDRARVEYVVHCGRVLGCIAYSPKYKHHVFLSFLVPSHRHISKPQRDRINRRIDALKGYISWTVS